MRLLAPTLAMLLAAAAPALAEGRLVTGTVSDPAGRPLGEVEVRLAENEAGASTKTDADGLFWLEAPAGGTLRFSKDGFLAEERVVDAETSELSVRLLRAATLVVRVQETETERPVAEAEVLLFDLSPDAIEKAPWLALPEDAEPIARGRTDRRGRLRLAALEPGLRILRVRAEGHATSHDTRVALPAGGTARQTVELGPARTVRGRVLGSAGQPVEGATVAWFSLFLEERPYRFGLRDPVRTDSEGRFQIDRDAGRHGQRLLAFAASGEALSLLPSFEEGATSTQVEIRLRRPGTVAGRVEDGEGRGIPEVPVQVLTLPILPEAPGVRNQHGVDLPELELLAPEALQPPWTTDEEGRFRIEPVPAGVLLVRAEIPGHLGGPGYVRREIGPGEAIEDLEIVFAGGHDLPIEVVNAQGDPISGASVTLPSPGRRSFSTGEDGKLHLRGLAEATIDKIEVHAEGFAPRVLRDVSADGELLVVMLAPAGWLTGTVYDGSTGEPIPAFVIRAVPVRTGERLLGHHASRTFSDLEGRFHFDGLAAGLYRVEIYAEDHLPEIRESIQIGVESETPLPPVHLDPGHRLEGVVTDAETGEPVVGIVPHIEPLDDADHRTASLERGHQWGLASTRGTDEEGRFSRGGLAEGHYLLAFLEDRYALWADLVELPRPETAGTLDIRLGAGGRIEIEVRDADEQPVENANVCLHPPQHLTRLIFLTGEDNAGLCGSTDSDGRHLIDMRLPAGRWAATLGGVEPGPDDPVVELRDHDEVTIVLQREGAVIGGAVRWKGKPVPSGNVTLLVASDEGGRPFVTRTRIADGAYELGPVPPGRYEIRGYARITDERGVQHSMHLVERVEVPVGTDRIVQDLTFESYTVRGRVVRADTGEPAGGVQLRFHRDQWQMRSTTDGAGAFSVDLSAPGHWKISLGAWRSTDAFSGWRVLEPGSVVVGEQGSTGLEVRIGPGAVVRGRVLSPDGQGIAGARIRGLTAREIAESGLPFRSPTASELARHLSSADDPDEWEGFTDSMGEYVLRGWPEGSVILQAGHPDHPPSWRQVNVRRDAETRGDLRFQAGGSLRILFDLDALLGADRMVLSLSRPGLPGEIRMTRSSEHGAYRVLLPDGAWLLPRMPTGTWTIEAELDGRSRRRVIEIQPGVEARVDLRD